MLLLWSSLATSSAGELLTCTWLSNRLPCLQSLLDPCTASLPSQGQCVHMHLFCSHRTAAGWKSTVVKEGGIALGVRKDVVRIHIAVADAVGVQVLQRAGHAERHTGDKGAAEGGAKRPAAAEQRLQVGLGREGLPRHAPQHQCMRLLQHRQHPAAKLALCEALASICLHRNLCDAGTCMPRYAPQHQRMRLLQRCQHPAAKLALCEALAGIGPYKALQKLTKDV